LQKAAEEPLRDQVREYIQRTYGNFLISSLETFERLDDLLLTEVILNFMQESDPNLFYILATLKDIKLSYMDGQRHKIIHMGLFQKSLEYVNGLNRVAALSNDGVHGMDGGKRKVTKSLKKKRKHKGSKTRKQSKH
jgi:hypothetical protein